MDYQPAGWQARIQDEVDESTGRLGKVAVGSIKSFAVYAVVAEQCGHSASGVQRDRCHCVDGYTGMYGGKCVQCGGKGGRVFWVDDVSGDLHSHGDRSSCLKIDLRAMGIKRIHQGVFGQDDTLASLPYTAHVPMLVDGQPWSPVCRVLA